MACDEAWARHFHPAVRHAHRHSHAPDRPDVHHTHSHPDGFVGEHAHAHAHEAVTHAHPQTHHDDTLHPHAHQDADAEERAPAPAGPPGHR